MGESAEGWEVDTGSHLDGGEGQACFGGFLDFALLDHILRSLENRSLDPVYGVTERGGQAKAVVAHGGVNATTAIPFLKAHVELGSKVMSDESAIYNRVKRDFYHEHVTHSTEEYVRGHVHTNSIEGFWGNMKNAISGTYHCVSPKYLQSYVNEFVFRYNYRAVAVGPVLLERAGKRI